MKFTRYIAAFGCTIFLFLVLVPASRAHAAPRIVQACPIKDLGTRVPVVLVHGFIGKPTMWDVTSGSNSQSMRETINAIPGLYPAEEFDYQKYSTHWVDDPHIGPALAQRVDYLAQASLCTHGSGKVIVVAHRMGGLATRYAAAQVVNGHKISDELGLVVTIGTPNFGSLVADVGTTLAEAGCFYAGLKVNFNGRQLSMTPGTCDVWSALLAMQSHMSAVSSLPMLPQSTPLMGIAGDVHSYFEAFDSTIKVSDSDTVVLTNSALVGHSQKDQGAGTAVFQCQAWNTTLLWSDGNCAHGNLPNNSDVQAQVVTSIQLYLISLRPKPTPTPTPSVPCPTWHQVEQAIIERETARGGAAPIVAPNAGPVCQAGFAGVTYYDQTPNGRFFSRAVLRFMNGAWVSEGVCHNDATGGYCDAVPSKVDAFFRQQGVATP